MFTRNDIQDEILFAVFIKLNYNPCYNKYLHIHMYELIIWIYYSGESLKNFEDYQIQKYPNGGKIMETMCFMKQNIFCCALQIMHNT